MYREVQRSQWCQQRDSDCKIDLGMLDGLTISQRCLCMDFALLCHRYRFVTFRRCLAIDPVQGDCRSSPCHDTFHRLSLLR